MLADRQVREVYETLAGKFDLARELIAAWVRAGRTAHHADEKTHVVIKPLSRRARNTPQACDSYIVID